MKPVLIENASDMAELLLSFEQEPILAVDTEFFRETSYYPQLGLIQIASKTIIACIDPLAFDASTALKEIFLNTGIIKVFHSCSQDLEVLFHTYGVIPAPMHDTQIAFALLSTHDQIGYANLVERELGISLAKSQTRTNWLKRPLTMQQLEYAGDDVYYLYTIYHKLIDRLKQTGRYDWFDEDCKKYNLSGCQTATSQALMFSVNIQSLWQRVKGSHKLNGKTLAMVQAIARWREQIAMQTDTTRRRVLADELILRLAHNPPRQTDDINWLSHNRFHFLPGQLETLLQTIQTVEQSSPEQWTQNGIDPLSPTEKKLLVRIQQLINKKAKSLGISASVLAAKKTLESFIKGNYDIRLLQGWRRDCIGRQLQEQLPSLIVEVNGSLHETVAKENSFSD